MSNCEIDWRQLLTNGANPSVDWSSVPLPAAPATHGTDLDGDTAELGQTSDGIDDGEADADGETVDGYIDDIDAGVADAEGEPDPEYVQGSDIDDNGKQFEIGGSRESEMGGSDGDSGDSGDTDDNGDTGDNGDSGDDGGDGGCGYDSGDNGTIDWNTVTNDDTNQFFNLPPLPPSEMDPPSADVARSPDPEFDRIWDLTTKQLGAHRPKLAYFSFAQTTSAVRELQSTRQAIQTPQRTKYRLRG